jgi:hypothetical protein
VSHWCPALAPPFMIPHLSSLFWLYLCSLGDSPGLQTGVSVLRR